MAPHHDIICYCFDYRR